MIRDGILRIEGNTGVAGAGGGGVPAGGFKDQVLAKKSNNSLDVGWVDAASFSAFDSNRPITRTNWPTNLNVGGMDIVSFLNAVFFPPPVFQELSFSIDVAPATSLYEYGTSPSITLNTTINQNGASYINNLKYVSGSSDVLQTIASPQFGAVKNTSSPFSVYPDPSAIPSPTAGYTVSFYATVTGDNNGTAKGYTSNSKTLTFEAPYYHGVGIDLTNTQIPTSLTKAPIQLRGSSKAITFNTPTLQQNLYFVYPDSWGLLSTIFTNGLPSQNLFSNFVTGIALSNGSTLQYRVYKSKNKTTCSNCLYTMNF